MSRQAFDPTDPFDAMAETFKREITASALRAMDTTIYRDLPHDKQLECFVAGTLTGLLGVCFAHVSDDGRDAITQYVAEAVPWARQQAESIIQAQEGDGR